MGIFFEMRELMFYVKTDDGNQVAIPCTVTSDPTMRKAWILTAADYVNVCSTEIKTKSEKVQLETGTAPKSSMHPKPLK